MSEMAKKARAAMKEKAQGRAAPTKGSVDASGWTEPTMNTTAKTGMRPISRRAFKKGGKVEGEAGAKHAGKAPRKGKNIGGQMSTPDFTAEDAARMAREAKMRRIIGEAEGEDGLYLPTKSPYVRKNGGRSGRANGGKAPITPNSLINRNAKEANEERGYPHTGGYKKGGKVHEDEAMDKKLIKAEMSKAHAKGCTCKSCGGSAGYKSGGTADPAGTRPTGGRMARKSGGRAKGKTNIHINIIAGEKHPEGAPAPMGLPGPLPRPPMPVAPPPMAGGAGMPPMGPPPGPMGGGLPPGLAVPPPAMGPMARKAGGRVGHRGYSSYKDMDAGAGSGLGRLEKTEIQKKKG